MPTVNHSEVYSYLWTRKFPSSALEPEPCTSLDNVQFSSLLPTTGDLSLTTADVLPVERSAGGETSPFHALLSS